MSNALRLAGVDPTVHATRVTVEAVVAGTALVSVQHRADSGNSPLHWRAGTFEVPPLDVAVDPFDGALMSIDIWIEDAALDTDLSRIADGARREAGSPILDRTVWRPKSDYVDSIARVSFMLESDVLFVRIGDAIPSRLVDLSGSVSLAFDKDIFCGLDVRGLDTPSLNIVVAAGRCAAAKKR